MKKALRILFCILALAVSSCINHEPKQAVDAVGDDATVVIKLNMSELIKHLDISGVKEMGEGSALNSNSEIKALTSVRGIDFDNLIYVSYSEPYSALIAAVKYPRLFKWSLGRVNKEYASQGDMTARKLPGEKKYYLVSDPSWMWVIGNCKDSREAFERVEEMKKKADTPLASWKRERMDESMPLQGLFRVGDKIVYSYARFEGSGCSLKALCYDEAGVQTEWLPKDVWSPLKGNVALIDGRNSFSLAVGRIDMDRLLAVMKIFEISGFSDLLPREFRHGRIGPMNMALDVNKEQPRDIMKSNFRITVDIPSENLVETIFSSPFVGYINLYPGLSLDHDGTQVTLHTSPNYPALKGTSYSGSNMVAFLSLTNKQLDDFDVHIPCSGVAVTLIVYGGSADCRIDFLQTNRNFLTILSEIL